MIHNKSNMAYILGPASMYELRVRVLVWSWEIFVPIPVPTKQEYVKCRSIDAFCIVQDS